MTSDPFKRLRGRLGREGGGVCLTRDMEAVGGVMRVPGVTFFTRLTLFKGAVTRLWSSYAATFSHVATTACVGVNFASGNPRCTSWEGGQMGTEEQKDKQTTAKNKKQSRQGTELMDDELKKGGENTNV